ncbi:hypothetical protein DMB42_18575 [Nonomuraea sp. WAC 01424]|uniref:DUF5947 family protein n=1 Tax=Nonomuraea sp. WAC 01424 TaxID=2203200 RepID=UPI000F7B4653|nr:DUF5947 family protein [Nonomuraea sp. WAC 01424]RSN09316.1 hypothetical protein DMB42_18575 [Nonomuraea sp. WAC 01424]
MSTTAYGRLLRRTAGRREDGERCELCEAPVQGEHAHVVDARSAEVMCACRACALLFTPESDGNFLQVPDRLQRLTGLRPADLGVPVSLAFFVTRPDGSATAHYPSPLGATRWELDGPAWQAIAGRAGPLRTMRPMVEALLVNGVRGATECWVVPIDDCYRLVALVRREWSGLSGGDQVWAKIEQYFAQLDDTRSRPG